MRVIDQNGGESKVRSIKGFFDTIGPLLVISVIFFVSLGCRSVKGVNTPVAWSENYALAKDVEATAPTMIDGDLETMGETTFDVPYGTNVVSEPEAFVKLPERKMIHRIVIHSPNLREFEVLARNQYDGWDKIRAVRNNTSDVIDLRVRTDTDGIRLRVQRTRDNKNASIREIELYGYANRDQSEQMK